MLRAMKSLLTPARALQALTALAVLAGVVSLLLQNATAREVTVQAVANIFGFVTTPFVLEASIAVFGLIAVVTFNQWRINREGDGWVTMAELDERERQAAAKSQSHGS